MSGATTLRQRAIAAARAQRAEYEAAAAEHALRARRTIMNLLVEALAKLGVDQISVSFNEEAQAAEAVVDGLLFRLYLTDRWPYNPAVMLPCQRCGQLVVPVRCENLTGLGHALDGSIDRRHWPCPAEPEPPPTPEGA